MTVTPLPQPEADLRLRATGGPLRTRVWWPGTASPGATAGILLLFVEASMADVSAGWLRELSSRAHLVIVSAPCAPTPDAVIGTCLREATVALEWAADHAAALEADAGRLYVGGLGTGAALAAAAALQARDRCWPAVAGQVLIQPDFHAYDGPGLDRSSRDVAPATVIVFGRGPEIRDGLRYAARLREASVDVRVLHHGRLAHVVDDLALALRDVRVAA